MILQAVIILDQRAGFGVRKWVQGDAMCVNPTLQISLDKQHNDCLYARCAKANSAHVHVLVVMCAETCACIDYDLPSVWLEVPIVPIYTPLVVIC